MQKRAAVRWNSLETKEVIQKRTEGSGKCSVCYGHEFSQLLCDACSGLTVVNTFIFVILTKTDYVVLNI
jgi:hypothetical protein